MTKLLDRARAYLDALEADRQSALALSEEKAEEAKRLQARLEGFQMALKMFGGGMPEGGIGVADDREAPAAKAAEEPARKRRTRRNIPELITRELSFSGQPMTARQIAKAIENTLERAETVLSRMEKNGQIFRDQEGRWAVGRATPGQMNGHAVKTGNGKSPRPNS
jgi:DNA repair exonuclease SbcCD ATPase subunit